MSRSTIIFLLLGIIATLAVLAAGGVSRTTCAVITTNQGTTVCVTPDYQVKEVR